MTFSELVDKIVEETRRGDRRNSIVCAVNDVLQRLHSKNSFDRDLGEARATQICPENKLVWPRPRAFRKMSTAMLNGNEHRVPDFIPIGKTTHRVDWDYYYYADENYIFCSGRGEAPIEFVNILYYKKPPNFTYYPLGKEPARWCKADNEGFGGWRYLTPDGKNYVVSIGNVVSEANARFLVTDWLLEEYSSIVMFGAINQLATLITDEDLRRGTYAIFQTGIADILRDNPCATDNA